MSAEGRSALFSGRAGGPTGRRRISSRWGHLQANACDARALQLDRRCSAGRAGGREAPGGSRTPGPRRQGGRRLPPAPGASAADPPPPAAGRACAPAPPTSPRGALAALRACLLGAARCQMVAHYRRELSQTSSQLSWPIEPDRVRLRAENLIKVIMIVAIEMLDINSSRVGRQHTSLGRDQPLMLRICKVRYMMQQKRQLLRHQRRNALCGSQAAIAGSFFEQRITSVYVFFS